MRTHGNLAALICASRCTNSCKADGRYPFEATNAQCTHLGKTNLTIFFGRPVINSMAVRTPGQFITRVLLNFFLPLHAVPLKTVKQRHIPLKTRNLLIGLKFRIKLAFVFSKSTQKEGKRTTGTCSGQCPGCDSAKIRRGGGSASLAEVCGSVDQGPLPPIPLRYAPQSRRFITRCGDKGER